MAGLVTSDPHAHAWSRFATTLPSGVNSRVADLLGTFDQVERLIEEHDVKWWAILGDLTHRRHFLTFSIYNRLMQRIVRVRKKYGIPIIVMPGNHDWESEGVHSLTPLSYADIKVVDAPEWVELPDYGYALFVPYMEGEHVKNACLYAADKRYPTAAPRSVFLHYALDGKAMGGGEHAVPSTLKVDDIASFARAYFGHVHSPSREEYRGLSVQYVGAHMHMDFGDTGDRFAWLLGDGDDVALKLHAPKFITTTYPRIAPAPAHSGFLRVLSTPADLFMDIKRDAREQGWLDCVPMEARMPEEAIRVLSSAVMVDEAVVREYVERHYTELDQPARDELIAFGLTCLREAQR